MKGSLESVVTCEPVRVVLVPPLLQLSEQDEGDGEHTQAEMGFGECPNAKTVLLNMMTKNRIVSSFKDSPRIPLRWQPFDCSV